MNGKVVEGEDQFSNHPLDITKYVVNGANDVEIILATTLWNKLRVAWPEIYDQYAPQQIGLTGPVTFSYFRESVISS